MRLIDDDKISLEQILAILSLGEVSNEETIDISHKLLELGYKSDSIEVIAGLDQADMNWAETKLYVEKMCYENKWILPSREEAVGAILGMLINRIYEQRINLTEGIRDIFQFYMSKGDPDQNDKLGEKYNIQNIISDYYQLEDYYEQRSGCDIEDIEEIIKSLNDELINDIREYVNREKREDS